MESTGLFDEKKLDDFNKPQLIELILELQKEKNVEHFQREPKFEK